MVDADPRRTPSFAMFAKPELLLQTGAASCGATCVTQNTGFAWNHGDYAAEINTNYIGLVGPGSNLGADIPPTAGPIGGCDSGQTEVNDTHLNGPWADEADIRPTMLTCSGLTDKYNSDGRVISRSSPIRTRRCPLGVTDLGECYSSSTPASASSGPTPSSPTTVPSTARALAIATYTNTVAALRNLEECGGTPSPSRSRAA